MMLERAGGGANGCWGAGNPWLVVARTPPPTVKLHGMMLLDDDEEYYDTEYGALREEEPG